MATLRVGYCSGAYMSSFVNISAGISSLGTSKLRLLSILVCSNVWLHYSLKCGEVFVICSLAECLEVSPRPFVLLGSLPESPFHNLYEDFACSSLVNPKTCPYGEHKKPCSVNPMISYSLEIYAKHVCVSLLSGATNPRFYATHS